MLFLCNSQQSVFPQPKRKNYEDFWEEFEGECAAAGLVSKVPSCMKKILTAAGYNSSWSFKALTEDGLSQIEQHIEQHHRTLVQSFEEYASIQPFQFLPGHRSLILGIKSEILELQEKRSNKRSKTSKLASKILEEGDLKTALLNQISAFTDTLKIKADWTNSIKDFSLETTKNASLAHCLLSCPICDSDINVKFEGSWKISNMCRHLRDLHGPNSAEKNKGKASQKQSHSSDHTAKQRAKQKSKVIKTKQLDQLAINKTTSNLADDAIQFTCNTYEDASEDANNFILPHDADSVNSDFASDFDFVDDEEEEVFN